MPPTPMRANFLPASGLVAGTLQKTSCAASRRFDQPASSDEAAGLGDVTGSGDAAMAVVAAALPPAASADAAAPPEPQAAAPSTAMSAAAARTGFHGMMRRSGMTPPPYHRVPAFATSEGTMVAAPTRRSGVRTRPQAATGPSQEPAARRSDRPDLGCAAAAGRCAGACCGHSKGFAAGPFDDTVVGRGQTLVSDQARPGSHDDLAALDSLGSPPATVFYTVFSEDERGAWRRQARLRLKASDPALGRRPENDFEAGSMRSGWLDKGEIARAGSGDNPSHP